MQHTCNITIGLLKNIIFFLLCFTPPGWIFLKYYIHVTIDYRTNMTVIVPYSISQTFLFYVFKYKPIPFLIKMPMYLSTYIFYPQINEYSKSTHI